jgi:hypothetical protein
MRPPRPTHARLLRIALPCLLPLVSSLVHAADGFAARCQASSFPSDDGVKVTSAAVVEAADAKAPPRHCRVEAAFEGRTGVGGVPYAIRMELRVPEGWNGRLLFQGGGGMNGVVNPAFGGNFNPASRYPSALARGFAVVSTDTGHVAAHGADAAFARDQQAKLNYAYAAIPEVTRHARNMIAALAGHAPQHSYFAGCSNGGREGMLMAQRYPALFDGVLAGNPAFNLRDAAVLSYATGKVYDDAARRDPAAGGVAARLVTPAEGTLIRKALLDRCDALDGAADGMIFDHAACRFDVRALACKPGQPADACLAPAKADAIARAFAGPLDRDGRPRFTPWTWDSSVFTPPWMAWQTGVVQPDGSVMTGLRDMVTSSLTDYFAFPPIRQATLGGDTDVERLLAATEDTARLTAATSTNLTTFAARGGKLMITDGWSDPIFSADDLVKWYGRMGQDMEAAGGKPAADFARLFMVPGMAHCAGGEALDDMDALTALVDWVERGRAPESLQASGSAFPGVTRPICAWPQVARYAGKGPLAEAASFRCER